MANNNDLFAPPSQDELDMFSAPTEAELAPTPLSTRVAQNVANLVPVAPVEEAVDTTGNMARSALDAAQGVASGLTLGALDELGGLAMSGVDYLVDKFDPTNRELRAQGFTVESADDSYRANQQRIQKELEAAEERSPVLYTGGQIAGGITSGAAMGALPGLGAAPVGTKSIAEIARNQGKLKALAELGIRGGKAYGAALPSIAVESALSSKEGAIETKAGREKLLEDVVGGAAFGLPAVLGLQAGVELGAPMARDAAAKVAQKGKDFIEDSPLLRQMGVSYDYGKMGINPKDQSQILKAELGGINLSELDNKRAKDLMKEILDADKTIGRSVGQSLVDATNAGRIVNVTQDTINSLNQLSSLAQKYPEMADSTRAMQIFEKISSNQGQISPIDAKDLVDYMDSYIGKFKQATNKTPLEEGILSNLIMSRKNFSNTLKTSIPEYARAAERFESFRRLVPETIIAKSRPVDVNNKFFGSLKDEDKKLFDPLKQLIQGATKEGSGNRDVQQAFVNAIKGMKEFEAADIDRLNKGLIQQTALKRPVSEIEKQIKKYSDDAVARGSMDALEPQTGVASTVLRAATGTGETGRAIALSSANLAGRKFPNISNNPVAKLGRDLYNAPDDAVLALSQKLKSNAGLQKYGQALEEALQSTDVKRKNQVLFTIMQNPSARALVEEPQNQEE